MTFISSTAYMKPQDGDWISKVKEIRAAKAEFKKYQHLMTQAETAMITDSIQDKINRYYPQIYQGMVGHVKAYIKDYQDKMVALNKVHQREITSWDSSKLGTEMHGFQTFLNMKLDQFKAIRNPLESRVNVAQEITRLYEEAQISGDKYKQRAAAEVLSGAIGLAEKLPKDQAVEFRVLAKKAGNDLQQIRLTPELREAVNAAEQAGKELLEEHKACEDIATDIGEFDNFSFGVRGGISDMAKFLRTVQQDRNTHEIKIYDITAPEVTGVYWKEPDDSGPLVIGG